MQESLIQPTSQTRHPSTAYWTVCQVEALFETAFFELIYRASTVHRQHFDPNRIQLSTLMSIKTGGCSEDCAYCSQSARYQTGLARQRLMDVEDIVNKAKIAKQRGATRFCMGAAWRGPKPSDMEKITAIIAAVKALGLETCGTFGLLKDGMAEDLKNAGLDYYNHNLDTAPAHYQNIIGTRSFDDRLETLGKVRQAGIKICCGGIVGMNERRQDRAAFIASLANLDPQPESVPINQLIKIAGTPLAEAAALDWTEFVRTIAVARITMPKSYVRLSAGRQEMSEEMQALCFMAGANAIFYGDQLLTTENPAENRDLALLSKLDLHPEGQDASSEC